MARPLALAWRGAGQPSPNPPVGAVVVRQGKVVGAGYHRRAGGPHAEVVALRQASPRTRGATLYVTLEPCCHLNKRTPPCVPLIIASGIKRMVVAMRDPNPQVRGRGLAALRRAGLQGNGGGGAGGGQRPPAPGPRGITARGAAGTVEGAGGQGGHSPPTKGGTGRGSQPAP